jgi:alpha-tubulin suppressor-like RCC1 family protein
MHRLLSSTISALVMSAAIAACSDTSNLVAPSGTEQAASGKDIARGDAGGDIRAYPANVIADFRTVLTPRAADLAPGSTYEWTFSDGSRASGAEITHVFSRKGSETVRLRITDGAGRTRTISNDIPVSASILELGQTLTGIVPGGVHTCAVDALHDLYCWGYNGDGNLGNGSTTDQLTPVLIGANGYTQIATGLSHSCGLLSDNTVKCWGRNRDGQLGDGTTTMRSTPTLVSGSVQFTSVSVGSAHSCGLDASGKAYCWGSNVSGQLGIGVDGGQSLEPVAVAGNKSFSLLRAGYDNTCAIEQGTGAAYCWGLNDVGQIGNNTGGVTGTETANAPQLVSGGLSFSQVDVGWGHACGLTTSKEAYCWGWSAFGQVGAPVFQNSCGTQPCSKVPLAVLGSHTFEAVSVGETHACAIDAGGVVFCWGNNDMGELGGGTVSSMSVTPAQVQSPSNQLGLSFKSIQSGGAYTCAVGVDNLGYCWGSNISGKLGVNDTTERTIPTLVSGLTF